LIICKYFASDDLKIDKLSVAILGLQSVSRESKDKDTAAMMVQLINKKKLYRTILLTANKHGGDDVTSVQTENTLIL
jgi:hypothetical protein